MLIVGLNGSPQSSGNTRFLIDRILKTAEEGGAETEAVNVSQVLNTARHCFCRVCSNPCTGICYKGTELENIFELMKKADGIILGSPVYFGTVSAQLKAFFDKTRKLRKEMALYNKVGAAVTVGGAKYGGQETTINALRDMMFIHGMIVTGDGYAGQDCGHYGVCAHRPSAEDEFALKRAEILGRRIIETCRATAQLRKNSGT